MEQQKLEMYSKGALGSTEAYEIQTKEEKKEIEGKLKWYTDKIFLYDAG
jgi:hypothetical protein